MSKPVATPGEIQTFFSRIVDVQLSLGLSPDPSVAQCSTLQRVEQRVISKTRRSAQMVASHNQDANNHCTNHVQPRSKLHNRTRHEDTASLFITLQPHQSRRSHHITERHGLRDTIELKDGMFRYTNNQIFPLSSCSAVIYCTT